MRNAIPVFVGTENPLPTIAALKMSVYRSISMIAAIVMSDIGMRMLLEFIGEFVAWVNESTLNPSKPIAIRIG